MPPTTRLRWLPTISALALLACGPAGPDQADAGATEATSHASSQASEPTGEVPTGGPDSADCGPCGTLLEGHVAPSTLAPIDGFIVAAAELHRAIFDLQLRFAADMRGLGDIYGLPSEVIDADFVAGLIAAITADRAANTSGGLRVEYVASTCHAGIDVAAEAQRSCEFDVGCELTPPGPRPAVQCAGTCLGDCAGACSGPRSCAVAVQASPCEGTCVGACTQEAPTPCAGVCHGDCTGACALIDGNGACAGACDGGCVGTCESTLATTCAGSCSGTCDVEQGSAQCSGAVQCAGACSSDCAGECIGAATPPVFAASCAAASTCHTQAAAQGLVALQCTPPALQLRFTTAPGLDAGARGAFTARTQALESRAPGILQDAARLRALVVGEVDGAVAFAPSPTASLLASLTSLLALDLAALAVPAGRRDCVAPAVQAAVQLLTADMNNSEPTLAAQLLFVEFITASG